MIAARSSAAQASSSPPAPLSRPGDLRHKDLEPATRAGLPSDAARTKSSSTAPTGAWVDHASRVRRIVRRSEPSASCGSGIGSPIKSRPLEHLVGLLGEPAQLGSIRDAWFFVTPIGGSSSLSGALKRNPVTKFMSSGSGMPPGLSVSENAKMAVTFWTFGGARLDGEARPRLGAARRARTPWTPAGQRRRTPMGKLPALCRANPSPAFFIYGGRIAGQPAQHLVWGGRPPAKCRHFKVLANAARSGHHCPTTPRDPDRCERWARSMPLSRTQLLAIAGSTCRAAVPVLRLRCETVKQFRQVLMRMRS